MNINIVGVMKTQEFMDTAPLVTIVTPAYNQADYLADTIESVLAQDYPHLEYIVLDDGSTDSTFDVLKAFEGRIRYERHENMGQANTLNKGWSMAKGSLIGYLSSDDLLEVGAISQLVSALAAHPGAVMAYCDYHLIDAKGQRFRKVKTKEYSAKQLRVELSCQPGPGALFRREIFDLSGGWRGDLQQVPDFEFWLRASDFGHFVRVPSLLADHRVHEQSASFRAVSYTRSMEIVEVMNHYWYGKSGKDVRRSVATAHLVASRSHGQSGRVALSIFHWCVAVLKYPVFIVSSDAWRNLVSGIFRRMLYRLRHNSG